LAKKVKIKDTDYLFLSSYIHAKEPKLVGGARLDRMLEAKTPEDALKVLEECGWPASDGTGMENLERLLADRREAVFKDMSSLAPDPKIVDLFRLKYDYHNAKVLMKAAASGVDAEEILSESGRIPPKKLIEAVLEGNPGDLPRALAEAYADASDTLSRTSDPQIADFIMDRAYLDEYLSLANKTGSSFMKGYGVLLVDTANLRSVVRAYRMKKDAEFLRKALVSGGTVDAGQILSAYDSPADVLNVFKGTGLEKVLEEAERAMGGGRLTLFEKLCDEVLSEYMSRAKMESFSEKPLIRYLWAVEAEISAVRIIMAGHYNGLPAESIKERLRGI
jgi:V/A-type H+-transporting ATPase subunit C